ncbi:MAG: Glycosyl transferase, group 2 family [Candidatus Roizmanbacteria bacterium GW2011_GWA2_35_19]|uniref:Glycosyl transferase, group 2 family n=2 Tax=Candidatus Roizmaniibacteriota TaxID=1752723 RepID=A0A0G0E9X3_9BACT|nr:MAG: Glycosyl transferase, group 2 family [Candidatus Roizmanbacteria bacterium GW2011_GWC2_35_12]KKP72080.1 MAG: Glycosyl transferase, group 2 family [Candidatus Roizmanbacteria bacterium GW2011_GWA2_35_19]
MESYLTVIIPTLNNIKGLIYLKKYFNNKSYVIRIIDNSKTNLGFAGGVNSAGLKDEVNTKWLLILNDDIEFNDKISNNKSQITNESQIINNKYQNTIEKLIFFAEENKLEAVTPVLRNPDGGIENLGFRVLPYGKIELINKYDKYSNNQIDGITAACLLIKTEVFKKLGGFDESFFAYLEDVDFFLRMKKMVPPKAGGKLSFGIAYDIEVLHNHMATSKTMGNFKAKQDMINWWRLYFKHPNKFKFNLEFVIERLRNVAGFVKASFNIK